SIAATLGDFNLYLDIARGSGVIQTVDAIAQSVTIQATPGTADLYLGTIDDGVFFDPGTVLDPDLHLTPGVVGSVSITAEVVVVPINVTIDIGAKSYATGEDIGPTPLTFSGPYSETQTAGTSSAYV